MFNDAQNLVIDGGSFTNIEGNFNQYNVHGNLVNGDGELGLHTLGQVASLSAIHDSSARYPPPSCHAETRLEVRKLILEWTEDRSNPSFILWLYGSAGVGKSAIMQSIAEELALREGSLGASFFFSAGKPDRNQGRFLFPTIAYQLAFSIPELRIHLNSTVLSNPTLHTKAINIQLRHLIIEPLRKLATSLQSIPTVLVDGLDECENHEIQRLILTLICEAINIHKLPIRFVIASRPEAHIREAFDTNQLCTITHRIPLDQSFQASRDIEKYLKHGFCEIYDRNPQVMAQVAKPWPEQGVIDLLVQKASGQFIYAATVLKFVGAEYYRPTAQLAIVLQPVPYSAEHLADLDHLYHHVLSSHNDPHTLVRVLGTMFTLRGCQPPEVIEDILGMEAGELSLILRGLHSVIHFPQSEVDSYEGDGKSDEERGLRLFHASFHDYLVDIERSGIFFVDEARHRQEVAFIAFELVGKWISRSWSWETHKPLRPRTWGYLRSMLAQHFLRCSAEDRHNFLDIIFTHLEGFWNINPNPQIQLAPLHCALSFIEQILRYQRSLSHLRMFPYSNKDSHDLADQLQAQLEWQPGEDEELCKKSVDTFKTIRSIIDKCYDLILSRSPELHDSICSVIGFVALVTPMKISDMVNILNVDAGLLEIYLERNHTFLFSKKSGSVLNWHFVDYLSNKRRSGHWYHDRRVDCVFLCIRSLSLSVEQWSHFEDCEEMTQRYFNTNFAELLNGIVILPTDGENHPLWIFVEYLEQILFYHPGLQDADFITLRRLWFSTFKILIWVQKQQQIIKELNTSLHIRFEQGLAKIVDKICQQILCVESTSTGDAITLCPPFLAAIKYDIMRLSGSREKDPMPFIIPALIKPGDVKDHSRLSQNLLFLELVNPSLERYLTSRDRARGTYISKDDFHTQLAEMWLDQCLDQTGDSGRDSCEMHIRLMAGNHCRPHLMQATGTERIFARLRVLNSWSFIGFSNPQSQTAQDIITWLEGLNKPPLDVYLRYQLMLLKAEGTDIEGERWKRKYGIPCEVFQIEESEAEQALDTITHTIPVDVKDSGWKHVFEGIGDGYLRLALFFFQYFYSVFYWRRQ